MPRGKKNEVKQENKVVYSLKVEKLPIGDYSVTSELGLIDYKSLKNALKEELSNVRLSKQAIKAAWKLSQQGPNQE